MTGVVEKMMRRRRAGFTLIELIGVMAIMTIMAGVLVPNVLRSIETASAKAEAKSVASLAAGIKACVRDTGTMPTSATWTAAVAGYSELSAHDLAKNRRQNPRVLLTDSTTSRAMILSVMSTNPNLTLPDPATINAAKFAQIWNTVDNAIPPTNWAPAIWAGWTNVANSEQWLIVERINLLGDLFSFPFSLNNNGTQPVSYRIISPNGTAQSPPSVGPGGLVSFSLRARQRLELFDHTGVLNYSYVVSTNGGTFDFDGTNWLPQ